MKALILRVGIDKGYGFLSPVFYDMTFEYLPIYLRNKKETERNEKRTYFDLIGNRNLALSEHLPNKLRNQIVHLDPEFETFTYGDPTRTKRAALLKLVKNDLLIFYFGGRKDHPFEEGCFLFGFFEIEKIIDWNETSEGAKKDIEQEFKNNAHIISSKSRNNLVMVKGNSNSRILKRCIQISDRNLESNNPPYFTSLEFRTKYGLRKNIVRAVPMYIHDIRYINSLKKLLSHNI